MSSSSIAPKEYGLIKRTNKSAIGPKLSIFDEDSDEDNPASIGRQLQKEAGKLHTKKQLKLDLQTALTVDPSVFQYDEIYDAIVQKREEQAHKQKRVKEKKPQYIDALLKAAKARKLDQEKIVERKIQKEREAEGDEFAGKEAFVTSGYKKKMLELQELENKEKREADLEALTDVTKQNDLSGFYRQLYKERLGSAEDELQSEKIKDETTPSTSTDSHNQDVSPQRKDSDQPKKSAFKNAEQSKQRHFRNPRLSTSSSGSDNEDERTQPARRQPEKRHTSSKVKESEKPIINTSDHSSDTEKGANKSDEKHRKKSSTSNYKMDGGAKNVDKNLSEKENVTLDTSRDGKGYSKMTTREKLIALFTKRHVGKTFENARERYLKRKESRHMFPLIIDMPDE